MFVLLLTVVCVVTLVFGFTTVSVAVLLLVSEVIVVCALLFGLVEV